MAHWIERKIADLRLAQLEIEHGYYLPLDELFDLMPNCAIYEKIYDENWQLFDEAAGSSHNHQAWEGGYMDHLVETMNIACQQYNWMSRARKMPFTLGEALEVMFLHDLEKPWKYHGPYRADTHCTPSFNDQNYDLKSKEGRKKFRADMIEHYNIHLSDEQYNALEYVEGVPDSKYTPGERTMGELAAFCHCCDILSARMWHDRGRNVNEGSSRWE